MKMRVKQQGDGDYQVVAVRTLVNEQPLAGWENVPIRDVPAAAEDVANQMRGETAVAQYGDWSARGE